MCALLTTKSVGAGQLTSPRKSPSYRWRCEDRRHSRCAVFFVSRACVRACVRALNTLGCAACCQAHTVQGDVDGVDNDGNSNDDNERNAHCRQEQRRLLDNDDDDRCESERRTTTTTAASSARSTAAAATTSSTPTAISATKLCSTVAPTNVARATTAIRGERRRRRRSRPA